MPPTPSQKLAQWRADPLLWIKEVLGGPLPWSRQEEILRAIVTHQEVRVVSGKACGKDWLLARVILWWFSTRPSGLVLATGPTQPHVETVLFAEVRKAYYASRLPLGGEMLPVKPELIDPQNSKHYVRGIVTNKPEALQGYHEDEVLIVADECAGIEDPWVFDALYGCGVTANSRFLFVGNPTCGPTAPFAKLFQDNRPTVRNIRISALESPNVVAGRDVIPGLMSREGIDRIRAACGGEDTERFRSQVLGIFPSSSSASLISQLLVDACRLRAKEPEQQSEVVRFGVDVARFGDDRTVLCVLIGNRAFFPPDGTLSKADAVAVVDRIVALAKRYKPVSIALDGGGLGGPFMDMLVAAQGDGRLDGNVQLFDNDFGARATDHTEHADRRTELWHNLKEWMRTEGAIAIDGRLEEELSAPTYAWRGRVVKLEEKKAIKTRLGRSPDFADALALATSGHLGRVAQRGTPRVYVW